MSAEKTKDRLLSIPGCIPAVFNSRPNRFLLQASLSDGKTVTAHVADPGRLKELLYPGNDILVIPVPEGSSRKTKWSLAAAGDSTGWILVNTTFHRRIATALFLETRFPVQCAGQLKAEVVSPSGKSRFDFLLNGDTWVEVKGCTLRKGREALFPDAPTTRGLKHVEELTELALSGIKTAIVFLVFVRNVERLVPNRQTDPNFSEALEKAVSSGVKVVAARINFDGKNLEYRGSLPVICNL